MLENREIDARLWQEYRFALSRFVLRRVDDAALAEDIVQDVLLKVYKQLNTLKDPGKILPWMYQIAKNAIVDHYRRYRPTEDIDAVGVTEGHPAEERAEEALAQCLIPWLGQLPAKYQQAVTLSEFDGMTQKEVALRLGLTLSGAKSRIQRGRKLLKKRLLACCRIELDRRGSILDYDCEECGR